MSSLLNEVSFKGFFTSNENLNTVCIDDLTITYYTIPQSVAP